MTDEQIAIEFEKHHKGATPAGHHLPRYPEDPMPALGTLINFLRDSTSVPQATAIKCGYVLLGVGLRYAAPDTDEELIGTDTSAIPWPIILPLLFDLLRKWLKI